MSRLLLHRLPDGTREVRILDEGVQARLSVTRYGSRGGGEFVVGESSTPRKAQMAEASARWRAKAK